MLFCGTLKRYPVMKYNGIAIQRTKTIGYLSLELEERLAMNEHMKK